MRVFVLLLSISVGSQALAQGASPEDVARACKAVENLPAPKDATTPPPKDKNGGECDPLELYYGTTGKPDYAAARACALAEWHNPADEQLNGEQMFWYAQAALAMIYANGAGVPRDVDRAMRIACSDPYGIRASNDVAAMINALLKVKQDSSRKFDYCEQAAGYDGAQDWILECEGIEDQLQQNRADAPLRRAMKAWTPAQRTAYATMMRARGEFEQSQSFIDADAKCGTGASGIEMDAESKLRIEMLDTMLGYESGHLPHFSHEDYTTADKVLNQTYSAMLTNLPAPDECSLTAQDYRGAERAWITYRDAWLAFAKVRWPQVPSESWLAELTRKRITELGGAADALPATN